jgi:hypothetical protein
MSYKAPQGPSSMWLAKLVARDFLQTNRGNYKYIVCDHIWDYSQKDKDYIWDNLHCFDIKEQKGKLIFLYGTVELMEQDGTGHGARHKPHAAENELDELELASSA